jgi:hypothetical protein
MRFPTLQAYLRAGTPGRAKGPVALIFAEDQVEVDATLLHHLASGFPEVVLLAPDDVAVDRAVADRTVRVTFDPHADSAVPDAVTAVAAASPGVWLYWGYNAEFLFHPFRETRSVAELVAFHMEERRDAFLSYVVDLYAGDLSRFPDAVSLETAMLDRTGYYALARTDPAAGHAPKDRQQDFFGGLRWRFEEHVPWGRRRIDRIALFRAVPGVCLRDDHTLNVEEMNTFACPWHNNITLAVASFRTAKALKTNPESRWAIPDFRWRNSVPFRWNSQQLMDLGLMEPGQWF